MILTTAEVRWFFPGPPSADVQSWFRTGDLWVEQPERVDDYLLLAGAEATGIKLRGGLFEVKSRIEAPTPEEYPNGVRGRRDAWVKWSREIDGAEHMFSRAAGERWLSVAKRRTQRGFSLDGVGPGDVPREIRGDSERPRRGCGIEVTEISGDELHPSTWWTLGLESYDADGDEVLSALGQVARAFFALEPPPMALETDDSLSYAAWLLRQEG